MVKALDSIEAGLAYPAHDLTYPNDVWTCPVSGVQIPKTLKENLVYRKKMVEWGHDNPTNQEILISICSQSPLFFLNTFCWTYRPKYTCEDGRVRSASAWWEDEAGVRHQVPPADAPIITWPAQDIMVNEIHKCFSQGGLLLADKSREQGATVIIMEMIGWAWIFQKRFSALVISRKAGMVDSHAEDSLFGKIDYMTNNLPEFIIKPEEVHRIRGNEPSMMNKKSNSRIIGETSNKDVGQSLRTTVTFVDEAARYPDQRALMKSIESVSAAYILASTPSGPGTEFSRLREKAMTPDGSKEIKVVTLGYWDHPQMGQGRQLVRDDSGDVTGKRGTYYWTSPAFRVAMSKSTSPRDIRENWLIDHDTSGLLVLDSNILVKMRSICRQPRYIGNFNLKTFQFEPDVDGKLKIWCPLDKDGDPPIDDNYVLGGDFSEGVDQSNTVLAIMSRTTGEIVAEYADPSIAPTDTADLAKGLGQWFGGQHGWAFAIWERNGPGHSFGHHLVRSGYPFVYYQRLEDRKDPRKTKKYGWTSTGDSKEILFATLNRFMKNGWFITRSNEGVSDMAQWIFDDHGRISCGKLRDLSTGAAARHGDRAIVYGVCCMGVVEAPQFDTTRRRYKPGTFGKIHEKVTTPREKGLENPFRKRRLRAENA